jgi:hypothetical protein
VATATLSLASILAATGWTGATTTALNTSDNTRATGGTVNEFIAADLVDVPTDWQAASGDIVLNAEALTSGNATRAKRLRLELLDANNTVLGTGETGNLSTTEATVSVTVTGRTDTQAQANGWRVRATVLESGGKGDNVSVSIDRLWVEATYDNSVPARTGSGSGTLVLTGSGVGGVRVGGSGSGVLPLTGTGIGGVMVGGSGAGVLVLSGSGTGTVETEAPEEPLEAITGSGAGTLPLVGAGVGGVEVWGSGGGTLTLVGVGTGTVTRIPGSVAETRRRKRVWITRQWIPPRRRR